MRRLALFNARMDLPAGLNAAPYTASDLEAAFAVAAAQQQPDIGRVDLEAADFEADWQRPSFDFRVDAFAQGRQHGAPRSGLSTDSRTGALSLYEKVGMGVVDTWVNRGIDL